MKALASLLILSCIGIAQEPSKARIITFSQTDTEHCKVVLNDGKPMLQTTYDGTSVAVSMPEKNRDGFSVFVRVTREGKGKVEVMPEKFTAVYSDPDHTRFQFVDLTREWEKSQKVDPISTKNEQSSGAITPASSQPTSPLPGTPPTNEVRATMPDGTTWSSSPTIKVQDGASRWSSEGGAPSHSQVSSPILSPKPSPLLRRTVLRQGNRVDGIVSLEKPKASAVELSSPGMLNEIDIPIGDVTFRF